MANEIWEGIQHLDLGRQDPELLIPRQAYAHILAHNRLSLLAETFESQRSKPSSCSGGDAR